MSSRLLVAISFIALAACGGSSDPQEPSGDADSGADSSLDVQSDSTVDAASDATSDAVGDSLADVQSDATGSFPCGAISCELATQVCYAPPGPGACPTPDSGVCPTGCPGCPALPAPSCKPVPSGCALSDCTCLTGVLCDMAGAGNCMKSGAGVFVQCMGM
jgi:hypothetical protein